MSFPLPQELIDSGDRPLFLFTDGACRGNPGPGAWAFLVQDASGEVLDESAQALTHTTNNRMEIQAVLEGIVRLVELQKGAAGEIHIFSDSKYVVDGAVSWMPNWKRRGWKKADKKTPENLDLWQRMDELLESLRHYQFHWVKGHAGHPQNEYVDKLANLALDELASD